MTQQAIGTELAVRRLFRHVESTAHADRPFVVQGEVTLTYGRLHELLDQVSAVLADARAQVGDRAVICTRHDLLTIVLYLGVMRCGVTPALVDPDAAPGERQALVQAARATMLFIDDDVADDSLRGRLVGNRSVLSLGRLAPGAWPDWLLRAPRRAPPAAVPDETSGYILFTSGTTSRPKGVEMSIGAIAAHMDTMGLQYGFGVDSVVMSGLPLHHTDGINHGAVNLMAAGGTLIRTGAFSVQRLPAILDLIGSAGVTHWVTVPTVLALLMRLGAELDGAFKHPQFKFVSSTAGPLDDGLWQRFERRFGTMVVNGFGLTETVSEGFYCGPSQQTRRIGTIGKPIDIEAKIIDGQGQVLSSGEMGELILRGSCVMKGYFDAPDETAAVLKDGWLHTGDLAVRDADGFYQITGRKKNVIICGGVNVYPEDVSRTLMRLPGVLDAATVGAADGAFGERVVSCVVLDPASGVDLAAVMRHCRANLAKEKVPSRLFEVSELPHGPSGKIALPQVRQIVTERLQLELSGGRGSAPTEPEAIAQRVMELAASAFKTDVASLAPDAEPETTDGWTSLAHMDFLVAIESTFDLQIAPQDMLDIVTLGDAIRFVQDALAERASSPAA